MPDTLVDLLHQIGLTKTEASVYLSMLTEGPSSILQLSQATDIKRSTIYLAIDSLTDQGLINIQMKGKRKVFAAESPKRLQSILNTKKNQLDQALPQLLNQFYNITSEDSFIKHYNGLEGVKSILELLLTELKPNDQYLVFSDSRKWHSLDPVYFADYTLRRSKLGLDIKLLLADTPSAHERKKTAILQNTAVKILPQSTTLDMTLIIVPSKVVIIQTAGHLMGMVIENQSYINLNKALFNLVWGLLDT